MLSNATYIPKPAFRQTTENQNLFPTGRAQDKCSYDQSYLFIAAHLGLLRAHSTMETGQAQLFFHTNKTYCTAEMNKSLTI